MSSSNIPLPAGGSFNGILETLGTNCESISINIHSDVGGVLRVFFYAGPSALVYEHTYTYVGGNYEFISVGKKNNFFRIEYTNGPTPQTFFQLRTNFNDYLYVDDPASGGGGGPTSNVNIVSSITLPVSDATTHGALGSMLTELISINNEILNPTSTQVITGTVFSQSEGSPDGGTTWEPLKTTAGAQNVIVDSGSVSVSNTSLDTHMYASSNGTTWHHVKSDANGILNTHSMTQDGNGNDITSTLSGTIRSLDVAVNNNVSIQNAPSSSLDVKAVQYGSYANLVNNQTINPYSASASINVSSWSYFIGYYSSSFMGSPSFPGALRIQYSFDNITFYNIFNTTIFPSSSGGLNVSTIYKQDIPTISHLRFYNDTGDILTNVNITIIGASLS